MFWSRTIILFALLSSLSASSQNTQFLRLQTHKGFIIPHSPELKPVASKNIWGISADYGWIMTNENSWKNCNCFAKVGMSAAMFNYNKPDILGNSYNVSIFGEPYLGFSRKLYLTIKGGMGVSYLDQVYHENTNPTNTFISAPISYILFLSPGLNYRAHNNWTIQLAANYNHISNGGGKQPNKGINFPTISIGIEHYFGEVAFPDYQRSFENHEWSFYGRLFSTRTVNTDSTFNDSKNLLLGIEAGVYRKISKINSLTIGSEFSFDGSLQEKIDRDQLDNNAWIFSIGGGHAFIFGRFYLVQQVFYYAVRSLPTNNKNFYQRYGAYYQIGKYLNLGFSLKAHGHVADHLDLRFGVVL